MAEQNYLTGFIIAAYAPCVELAYEENFQAIRTPDFEAERTVITR